MNLSEKIEYLRRIQAGDIIPFDMEPFFLVVSDHHLPENEREYFLWREGKCVLISRTIYEKLKAPIILIDKDDMNV